MSAQKGTLPFYKKTWFIVILLIFFAPAGIALMWLYKKEWINVIKVVVSVIFGLLFIAIYIPEKDKGSVDADATTTPITSDIQMDTAIDVTSHDDIISTLLETMTEKAIQTNSEPDTTAAKATTTTRPTTTATTKLETTTKPTTTTTTKPETTTKSTTTTKLSTTVQTSSITYVLNSNTHKIHFATCHEVNKISPENYSTTDDYNAAISNGYVPCKKCNPY